MNNKMVCPHAQWCGGCQYQGIAYEDQLIEKSKEVTDLLASGGIEVGVLGSIVGSPEIYHYRNKMEYTFGDFQKDGPLTLGMHRKGNFMSVVTVDHCQLVPDDFNLILDATLAFASPYPKYHKKRHDGLLRNLIIRRGVRTDELLINLVTSGEEGFDEEGFASMLLELPLKNRIVGILRTINENISDVVKCDEMKILYGRDHYMEHIMDLDFKVSAFSFFQSNVNAVEKLYQEALSLIPDSTGKVVYDLFCGTGTIAQSIAKEAAHVFGIELIQEAVDSAIENEARNGLNNCTFLAGDVFDHLDRLGELPDVIIMDPPRVGISEKSLDKIMDYHVKHLIYVSCNPKSLVKNLAQLQNRGYRVTYLQPFDNFPFTKHIECVCHLELTNI